MRDELHLMGTWSGLHDSICTKHNSEMIQVRDMIIVEEYYIYMVCRISPSPVALFTGRGVVTPKKLTINSALFFWHDTIRQSDRKRHSAELIVFLAKLNKTSLPSFFQLLCGSGKSAKHIFRSYDIYLIKVSDFGTSRGLARCPLRRVR